MPGTASPPDRNSERISELAVDAIDALAKIDSDSPPSENQALMSEAASYLEEMAKLLRGDLSGREVVLELLKAAYPYEVRRDALRHVSGIQTSARRIRELRVQDGYRIEATEGGYRLLQLEPDEAEASRWTLLNRLRRSGGSAETRIRALFEARVGETTTLEEIEYVAQISSAARRLRELRTEQGLRIESYKDNPELRPSEYVLVDATPIPASERAVSAAKREQVLVRDGFSCAVCGQGPDGQRRIWLEVDHIEPLAAGGSNETTNLRTLCNDCHRAR